MSTIHFIALDTHCSFCEMAVMTKNGKLLQRQKLATAIPPLVNAIEAFRKPRYLTLEEGPLADWLARHLRPHVDRLVVCEPRRNRLIAKDGDKDDPIDARKLAELFRGGYLKEVHQVSSLERSELKQHVGFYHDRVRDRVRQGHQLVALLRRHGLFVSMHTLMDPDKRQATWARLPEALSQTRHNLDLLYQTYELLCTQEVEIRQTLVQRARKEEPVTRFVALPGIGWIRALTFFVYLDTPARFSGKSALWRYCGIGLRREHSGRGATRIRLDARGHRHLKNVLLGAAKSAILQANNPFADKYRAWTQEDSMHPSTARRNVARGLAATLWSLWKTGSSYDPNRVIGKGRATAASTVR